VQLSGPRLWAGAGEIIDMERRVNLSFQPTVSRLLTKAVSGDRLHSAYLFVGEEGFGKWRAAVEFAAQILALGPSAAGEIKNSVDRTRKLTHPDLHLLYPTPSPKNRNERLEFDNHFRNTKREDPLAVVEYDRVANILVENARSTRRALYSTSAERGYRVAVVHEVERMPDTSFDILLKTIEEPPPQTVMILTTSNVNRLPATIISRCQKVRFLPIPDDEIVSYLTTDKGTDAELAHRIAKLSNGSFTEAFRLVSSDIDSRRDQAMGLMKVFVAGNYGKSVSALLDSVNFRNREEALDLIRSWMWLLRDTCMVCEGQPASRLINSDQEDALQELSDRFPDASAIHRAMVELLETKKLFYRNVPSRTALTRFAWSVNDIVKG
jgi:DNA polymerase-3 subunit delta'